MTKAFQNDAIIGVGIDLENVAPFREKPVKDHLAFYQRLFSEDEIAYCGKHRDPAPFFAARFCAKEALVKASRQVIEMMVTDCEVAKTSEGAPFFQPRRKKREMEEFFAKYEPHLSMTHTEDFASAFVVLVLRPTKK